MSYRWQNGRNWGALIACLIAVPLSFLLLVIVFAGGSLVCADAASHCDGILRPLVEGLAIIAGGAVALAWGINRIIRGFKEAG